MESTYRALFLNNRATLDCLVDLRNLEDGCWRYATVSEFFEKHDRDELRGDGVCLDEGETVIECQDGIISMVKRFNDKLFVEPSHKVDVIATFPDEVRKTVFSSLPISTVNIQAWQKDNPQVYDWEVKLLPLQKEEVFEIFEIINTAKSMRFYAITNAAMAVLVDEAIKNEELQFYLETQDSASSEQTYYDLLGVFDPESEMRAVIPAPLVSNSVFCYLAKSGRLNVIDKIDHVREFVEPNFEEQQKLMKRLSALSRDVLSAISINIQPSGEEDDCAKMVDLILTLETDDSPYFRFDLANKWKGSSSLRVA